MSIFDIFTRKSSQTLVSLQIAYDRALSQLETLKTENAEQETRLAERDEQISAMKKQLEADVAQIKDIYARHTEEVTAWHTAAGKQAERMAETVLQLEAANAALALVPDFQATEEQMAEQAKMIA